MRSPPSPVPVLPPVLLLRFERSRIWAVKERPVSADELSDEKLQWLRDLGLIDSEGNVLREPREVNWKPALFGKEQRGIGRTGEKLKRLKQRIMTVEEILNRCWGQHEFASDFGGEVLDWLVTGRGGGEGGRKGREL